MKFLLRALQGLAQPGRPVSGLTPAEAGRLDWTWILRASQEQGMAGFLHKLLEDSGLLKCLEAPLRAKLGALALWAGEVQRGRVAQFSRIVKILGGEGVPVIPIKGVALSAQVYKEMPFRGMADVDILVKEEDHPRAREALCREGFKSPEPRPLKNRWHNEIFNRASLPELFRAPGKETLEDSEGQVDLHWRPIYAGAGSQAPILCADLWARARPFPEFGPNVYSLAPRDQARWVLAHTLDLYFPGLVQMLDLLLLLRAFSVPPRALLEPDPTFSLPLERIAPHIAILEELGSPRGRPFSAAALDWCRICIEARRPNSKTKPDSEVACWRALRKIPTLRGRFLFLAGYLIPDPTYYRGKGRLRSWAGHWAHLLTKPLRVAAGRIFP